MKQDYLWDKSGADPEIENLENALAAFRFKENAPPALPVKAVPIKKELPRRSFRFAYAIAACAAFAMIGWGGWYQFSGYEIEIQENLVKTTPPQNFEARKEIPVVKKTESFPDVKIESTKQIPARKFVKTNKTVQPVSPQKLPKPENIAAKSPDVRLTKEEKYAYDQLMLALSITSSKLKMVKDKVENSEEETIVLEQGR